MSLQINLKRRQLLAASALALVPSWAVAGAQREETLSDDVASVMRQAVNNVNPPRLVFASAAEGQRWLNEMSLRLARFVADEYGRKRLLTNIHYESARAGLDTRLNWLSP